MPTLHTARLSISNYLPTIEGQTVISNSYIGEAVIQNSHLAVVITAVAFTVLTILVSIYRSYKALIKDLKNAKADKELYTQEIKELRLEIGDLEIDAKRQIAEMDRLKDETLNYKRLAEAYKKLYEELEAFKLSLNSHLQEMDSDNISLEDLKTKHAALLAGYERLEEKLAKYYDLLRSSVNITKLLEEFRATENERVFNKHQAESTSSIMQSILVLNDRLTRVVKQLRNNPSEVNIIDSPMDEFTQQELTRELGNILFYSKRRFLECMFGVEVTDLLLFNQKQVEELTALEKSGFVFGKAMVSLLSSDEEQHLDKSNGGVVDNEEKHSI